MANSQQTFPKRVILRLLVDEFKSESLSLPEFDGAIEKYLAFARRPTSENAEGKHYAHVEPFQESGYKQKFFHVILDIDKDAVSNPAFDWLEHQIYRVCRDEEGTLKVIPFKNPLESAKLVREMRVYTDKLPWGMGLVARK
ncbi:hypothetical protein G7Y89_g3176 [Cudoniella acicularis]|uniref:Uncharacterized protein n=1 Tax=Cudoniella acicularis TaxID=354080 RepID=A0A8H4W5F1_9HELO|nr:hypothetical protein G7Y89_g3176 [Cudoniella acicularis]